MSPSNFVLNLWNPFVFPTVNLLIVNMWTLTAVFTDLCLGMVVEESVPIKSQPAPSHYGED